jgi:hypothetical protein
MGGWLRRSPPPSPALTLCRNASIRSTTFEGSRSFWRSIFSPFCFFFSRRWPATCHWSGPSSARWSGVVLLMLTDSQSGLEWAERLYWGSQNRVVVIVKDNCFSALTAQAVRFRHGPRLHQIKRTRVFAVQVNCKQLADRFSLRKHRSLK